MKMDAEITARAAQLIVRARAKNLRLATVESCTGGLVAAALTEITGASDVVEGGFITYANSAKYLGAEAGHHACQTAVLTLGGMGYAKEYHVERLLRESYIPRIAPVSPQLILCFIAEKVLGLPKSY